MESQLLLGIETWFEVVVDYIIVGIEMFGAGLLTYVAIKGIINIFKKNPNTKLELGEGIATALEFVMVGEVLKTIVSSSTELKELAVLGLIIVFRVILTFLIHWEIKEEKVENSEKTK